MANGLIPYSMTTGEVSCNIQENFSKSIPIQKYNNITKINAKPLPEKEQKMIADFLKKRK